MYDNLAQKIEELLSKDIDKKKHEELLIKMQNKLKKLHGKDDSESKQEIFIIKKTIQKLEKKLLK